GRDLYQDLCWQCHGPAGQGDGPLAAILPTPPPSVRGLAPAAWPALVDLIRAGRGDMPAYSATLDLHDTRRILVWLAALDKGDSSLNPTRPSDQAEDAETPDQDGVDALPGAAALHDLKPSH
ncbi:MAG: cytochrome c, partial [Oligoflexia bacterium]|nr:cytochrome c [Oligoflexia bacterium]